MHERPGLRERRWAGSRWFVRSGTFQNLAMSALLFTAITAAAALPSARILDATGSPSNQGLLQVQTEFGFGSVWSAWFGGACAPAGVFSRGLEARAGNVVA